MFTPREIMAFIIALCGFILTILNIIDKQRNLKKEADEPFNNLKSRVDAHDVILKQHEESMHHGNDRFREQEDTNEVMQICMLALIDFELSYCLHTNYEDTEDLMKAKDVLRKHLARR